VKSILVPVEDHDAIAAVMKTAMLIGRHLDGIVEGITLRTMQLQVAGAEPIVAVSFPTADRNTEDTISRAKAHFDEHSATALEEGDAVRISWKGSRAIDDIGLGCLARVYDLTVIGRPSDRHGGPRMTTLESALFDSGRPVLIAPSRPPALFGKNIVVSWNCSTEAARTLAFAMPLLYKAEKVSVLTIKEAIVTGPSGAEVCSNLAVSGIKADNHVISAGKRKPGAAILAEAAELGCDLLIKSAYTQSRLRQMIFGGATSYILANANLPVFMAN